MNNNRKYQRQFRSPSVRIVPRPTDNKIKPIPSNIRRQTHPTSSELPPAIDDTYYSVPATKFSIDSLAVVKPFISTGSSESQLVSSNITNGSLSNPASSCWPFSRQKTILCGIVLALLLCIAIAVPAAVLSVVYRGINQMSSFANITAPICTSSSCVYLMLCYSGANVRSYAFDENTFDNNLIAAGIGMGATGLTPSYTAGGYVGSAINLDWSNGNYVIIPYINISYQSFTIEVWIGPVIPNSGIEDDYGIFQQCDDNQICFILTLRTGHIQLSFDAYSTDPLLISTEVIDYYSWTHVAIVYDAVLFQQLIYINGNLDTASSGMVESYQGSSVLSNTTIGMTKSLAYNLSYFSGRIDNFVITEGVAKTACQILNDATLIVYFPFDTTNTMLDQSVNNAVGISSGTSLVTGRIEQGLLFSSTTNSYFQSQCLSNLRRGNPLLTFALWINPVSVSGGTIIHLSESQNGSSPFCSDFLSLTASGYLVIQLMQSLTATVAVQGPKLQPNTWTHLIIMISSPNGIRLLMNGLVVTTYPATVNTVSFYYSTDVQLYVTLGNSQPTGFPTPICVNGTLTGVSGAFSGTIDDFRIYSRELSEAEICNLANP